MKSIVSKIRLILRVYFFDPVVIVQRILSFRYYFSAANKWQKLNTESAFQFKIRNMVPLLDDRFSQAGEIMSHYFFQDIWAADNLIKNRISNHIDIGSSLSGFVAHLLSAGCNVTYVDIRELLLKISGLKFIRGNITSLPFADNSVQSLSCLHVIEHIGLGRYGDPINPDGFKIAASEMVRVLSKNGVLIISTPVGQERLAFNSQLVFSPERIVKIFAPLKLQEFNLIPDRCDKIIQNASFYEAGNCRNGCGLFIFRN